MISGAFDCRQWLAAKFTTHMHATWRWALSG
ncbi:hypothetical protein BRAS3809_7810001 [Bradyrhizobium sp. STM 3809]|nr:hypothetical protein BRAS3809_7810001 [Bradyrhizobium sp. STM 3809]